MRVDARLGDVGWFVWDVKRCHQVPNTVWCDDETGQWGGFRVPFSIVPNGYLDLEVHQEDRIRIYPDRKLVLFNEVDDQSDQDERVVAVQIKPGSLRIEFR